MSKPFAWFLPLGMIWVVGMASGCCADRMYRPSGCVSGLDPLLGACNSCESCGGGCGGQSPAQGLRHKMTCASGCGEIYWGEWLSDPPDACDPCDNCGDWVGERCCPQCWWQSLSCGSSGLWGWRCGDGCSHGGGCSSCGTDGEVVFHSESGDVINGEVPLHGEPTPNNVAPKSGHEAAPKKVAPPQPMPETPAGHTRINRQAAPKPFLLQPTRSARSSGSHPHSALSGRTRSL